MYTSTLLLALLPAAFAAPLLAPRDAGAKLIPGKYIVKMKPEASKEDLEEAKKLLANTDFEYEFGGFNGFAGSASTSTVSKLQKLDTVQWIEQDAEVHALDWLSDGNAPWGLGRISHIDPGNNTYVYDSTAGEGTCSYVLDTGIYVDHPEFEGRAEFLQNFSEDGDDNDGNGHGTHCAGTIGSKSYGVAKKTKLYGVKVLDNTGFGSWSGVIAGINFVAQDSQTRDCPKGSLANMSLGGTRNEAVNQAVAAGVAAGVFFGIAAGNGWGSDAANYSPASELTACTVGATDINDVRADFSNVGAGVDVYAPGVNVLSTWNNGETLSISGTSMAAPHVVGLAAYLLTFEDRTTEGLCERIVELAHQGKITDIPEGTPNLLAYNAAPTE